MSSRKVNPQRKFSRRSCRTLNSQPFDHESGDLTNKLSDGDGGCRIDGAGQDGGYRLTVLVKNVVELTVLIKMKEGEELIVLVKMEGAE